MAGSTPRALKVTCPACHQKLDVSDLPAFAKIKCPTCGGPIIVPRSFGELMLEEPIGQGTMAAVYRALDLTLDREVAVKILDPALAKDPALVPLFLQAARKVAVLNHPNVVPIYSCGECDGQPYVVMQYMGGHSLARQMPGHPVREQELSLRLRQIEEAARGLEAASRQGILHLDLKPGSILLDTDGNVKVADFGLTDAMRTGKGGPGRGGSPVSAYTCPEAGSGLRDARGDMYGLGAVLYQLLTGAAPPVPGPVRGDACGEGTAPALSAGPLASLPREVAGFVQRLLAPSVEGRPQTYEEVIRELVRLRHSVSQAGGGHWGQDRSAARSAGPRPAEGEAQARVDLTAVAQRAAAAAKRRHAATGWVNGGLALSLILLLLTLYVAGRRRAAWYVEHVEPWVHRVVPVRSGMPRTRSEAASSQESSPGAAAQGGEAAAGTSTAGRGPADGGASAVPDEAWATNVDTALVVNPEGAPPAAEVQPAESAPTAVFGHAGPVLPRAEMPPVQTKGRPQPADLDFFAVKSDLEEYVRRQPQKAQPFEKERIRQISTCRGQLLRLLRYIPYDDPDAGGIRLRDGRVLAGSVPFSNEKEVCVRVKKAGTEGLERLAWSDLAFEQYVAFLDFYAQLRLGREGPLGDGASREQRRREAGADYWRVALLCDWYGLGDLAAAHAASAVECDPSLKPLAEALIPSATREADGAEEE